MGQGIGTEVYEFEKIVQVSDKERQNGNKLLNDALNMLQVEREHKNQRSTVADEFQEIADLID